jgi:hypothetical protein
VRAPNASLATPAVLGGIVVALVVAQSFNVPRKPYWGLDQAAQFLMANQNYKGAGFLIVGDAKQEGAFVAEVVMHDARPDHFVLRSSKVLVDSTWFGTNYKYLYPTADGLRDFLDHAPISAIVLHTQTPPADADEAEKAEYQLQQTVAQALAGDSNWKQAEGFHPSSGTGVQVYTRVGPQPSGEVQLTMRYTLGSNLVVHNNAAQVTGALSSATMVVLATRTIAVLVAIAALFFLLRRRRATDEA